MFTAKLTYGPALKPFTGASFAEISRAYQIARRASGLGASQFGPADVYDEAGRAVAHISYNGRVWRPSDDWRKQELIEEAAPLA